MPPKPHLNLLSTRQTFPPILHLPARSTGNNVPKSLHKTRRTWHPNVHRVDQVVRVLEVAHSDKKTGAGVLRGVKMRVNDLRSYRKAGGVEGCLLSRPSKHFTDFGKQLRADLFTRLIAVRDANKIEQQVQGLATSPEPATTAS